MRRIERLRLDALNGCALRGHDMGRFERDSYWHNVRKSACKTCGLEAHINARPMPNEIDIGGQAVALFCGDVN